MCKLHGQITREFLGLRVQNFQVIVFIWTQTYREIKICISVSLSLRYFESSWNSAHPVQAKDKKNVSVKLIWWI